MLVAGRPARTLWLADDGWSVNIIDQTRLPDELHVKRLQTLSDVAQSIRRMEVRGAPLIGVAAAYGVCLAMHADASDAALDAARRELLSTRPTAVNLRWALDGMVQHLSSATAASRVATAYGLARALAEADVATCEQIGRHGEALLRAIHEQGDGAPVQVLTHCNAGWLATIDWGTALAPIYRAHDSGIPVHVWVDETRPRNQGYLTAWELAQHGVPHTVIVDNAGGLLMQQGRIDMCIVGTDRTARNGDVANKIGTYLKALAARDNGVPFWAAVPSSSIDWDLADGSCIPIEIRDAGEIHGLTWSTAHNPGFDVTPARLVTGLITERGRCAASEVALLELFPERARAPNELAGGGDPRLP